MDAAPGLALSTVRSQNSVVVGARGELDFGSIADLVDTLKAIVDRDDVKACIIDCEKVTFIDSEAVKALLQMKRRFSHAGKSLTVRGSSRPVRRLLTLLGVQHYLLCPDDDEPMQSV